VRVPRPAKRRVGRAEASRRSAPRCQCASTASCGPVLRKRRVRPPSRRERRAGHPDSDPDAHAVQSQLDRVGQKRAGLRPRDGLEGAVAVQGADILVAHAGHWLADRGVSRMPAEPGHLCGGKAVHGTTFSEYRGCFGANRLFQEKLFCYKFLILLARPERFELPTPRFVVWTPRRIARIASTRVVVSTMLFIPSAH
jgi:hypothetical protein